MSCPVCALPDAEFEALHRDYAQRLLTVRGVALRYGAANSQLSIRTIRRHLKTHIPLPVGDARSDGDPKRALPVRVDDYVPFLDGVLDAEGVLITTVRRTLQDLARVEAEMAAARSVTDATRALAICLRAKEVLVRQLKELEAARQPRKRLLHVLLKGLEKARDLAEPRLKTLAQEHLQRVQDAMDEFHKVARWKVLKEKLNVADTRLQDALRAMVKEVFLEMAGWVESELTETVGWQKKADKGGKKKGDARPRPTAADLASFPF